MNIIHQKASEGSRSQKLGPYEIRSLIPEDEEAAMTAYLVVVEAGQTTSESYHKIAEECYYVLSGSGIAVLNGVEHSLEAGDFLRLPPGTRHRFKTDSVALKMLDWHSPGTRPNKDVFFTDTTPDGFTTE